ncbi:AAA family ATPase [Sphaerotilaceae bacterium SBD11-9]
MRQNNRPPYTEGCPMTHPCLNWRPGAKDETSVANLRVALALLRIYRYVALPQDEADMTALGRVLWPAVREFPKLFRAAWAVSPYKPSGRRAGRLSDDDGQERLKAALASAAGTPTRLALEPADSVVFEVLGDGLVTRKHPFEPLFDAVEARLATLTQCVRAKSDLRIDLLASLIGLTPLECDFLRLCSAVNQSPVGSSAFSLARAPVRLIQAVKVALQAPHEHDVRSMLSASSRLVRSGLLDSDSTSFRHDLEDALRLSRQAILLLDSPAHDLDGMASVVLREIAPSTTEDLSWPHLEERLQLLKRIVEHATGHRERGVNILLYGEPGTGKTQFASRMIESLGLRGFAVADVDKDGGAASRAERLASLMLTQLFAPAGGSVVLLDEAEDIFQAEYHDPMARALGKRDDAKSWMNHLLEDNAHPILWISNRIDHIDPAYLRRFTYCIEFPRTPRGVRRAIARTHLEVAGCTPAFIDEIACEPLVSPALLSSAARVVRMAGAASGTASADGTARLVLGDMVKAIGGKPKSQVPERTTRFDAAYLNVKGRIPVDVVLDAVQRRARGRLLLSGPPGTGKTQLAAEVAQRMGRELVYRTASDINSMWYGQSERNVARLFEECDAAAEVLFVDEADTLMASRDGASHRADLAVTAEFLRHVEAFKGVFVCATNFQAQLDPALLRRFEFRLEMLTLSRVQRTALFCECALGWKPSDGEQPVIDSAVARRLNGLDALTPGDFANVIRRLGALELKLDAAGFLEELEGEHAAKLGSGGARIGFLR